MSIREKLQILVVDDMSTSRGLIIQSLEEIGIKNIHNAPNAKEGLNIIAQRAIHLILSDFNMPSMDGLQLLRTLKSNNATKSIGFILITGRADKSLIEKGRLLGMNNFIKKPFSTAELRSCLESVVGKL